jgi:hypothetical protein
MKEIHMKLVITLAAAAALLVPATAGAFHSSSDSGAAAKTNSLIAKNSQDEGTLGPNACSATRTFKVSGPSNISVLTAGTNAGGQLSTQVIGRSGDVGSDTGSYQADSAGSYGYRVCFRSDGIDDAISYVSLVVVSPR